MKASLYKGVRLGILRHVCSLPYTPIPSSGKTYWESISGRRNGTCKGPEAGESLAHSEAEIRSVRLLHSNMRDGVKFREVARGHITLDL